MENRLGLHARPAARFVAAVSDFDARVEVGNATREKGPADARSLTALAILDVRQGDEILVRARGAQARDALDALRALADANFGDARRRGQILRSSSRPLDRERPTPRGRHPLAARGCAAWPASAGIAIGPARRLVAPEPPVDDGARGHAGGGAGAARLGALRRASGPRSRPAARERARRRRGGRDLHGSRAAARRRGAASIRRCAAIDAGAGAGRAWQAAAAEAAAAFRALDDPYLRERAVDVEDVARRVLARLAGKQAGAAPRAPGIVVAGELTPGEAAGLDPELAWAIATARGGPTGHAAILARALGIPAVVGLGDALLAIPDGTPLALDGAAGDLDVDPDAGDSPSSRRAATPRPRARAAMLARASEPGALRDGRRVEVFANVGSPAEARLAVEQGAEGVGLLRTEFLFLDRATPPDEDEQVEVLRAIARALDGRRVIVRTLDAGADKPLPFLRQAPEDNPFLGRRGIRLSLAEPALFRTQLRAILRVAAEHPLAVMFPMVATRTELRAARGHLDAVRAELGSRAELDVGVMVEVPALALQAAQIAPEVDFFSVGTNDLAQYAMAAERGNAALAALLDDALAPVLSLIATVVAAADAHGRWVGVCGELAGEPDAAVLLAGLGVRELSMAASRIPAVKAALREVDPEEAAAAARRALPRGAR